jgi:nicotinate-nucleotide pyrophosphorylase (carboxylating)
MNWPSYITVDVLDDVISRGLAEDVGPGDITTVATVSATSSASGFFAAKEDGILAGAEVAARVFRKLSDRVDIDWHVVDGELLASGMRIASISGPARPILTGERLALNVLQRMSGIATTTRRLVDAVAPYGAEILDTRKTAPGLRALDKWAVRLGGGRNHRVGLYDMILIKDNHIAAAGSLSAAVDAARRTLDARADRLELEVEVSSLVEVQMALKLEGIDVLLLDNMIRRAADGELDTSMLAAAVQMIAGTCRTEASGNMDLDTAVAAARCGVDYISVGGLTHSIAALDISLTFDMERAGPPGA